MTARDPIEGSSHPGRWWHKLDDGRIQCDLCPRDCKLHEGQRGACFVRARVNDAMVLTTYGRSSGFCVDPIEKKPLNHFLPGSAALSFGTAGCNLACKFCFSPRTWIATNGGMRRIRDLFDACPKKIALDDGCIGFPEGLEVWTRHAMRARVAKVFARPYVGPLVLLRPASCPPIEATPNHGIFAVHRSDLSAVRKIAAGQLTTEHFLIAPKREPSTLELAGSVRTAALERNRQVALHWSGSGTRFDGGFDRPPEASGWRETETSFLVPLQCIEQEPYSGSVYNLEVDDPDHSYLAPFLAVANCQNWDISKSRDMDRLMDTASPKAIAEAARDSGCASVAYTYNDPVIFAEYAMDIADACRDEGILNVAVTAGYIGVEARREFYAKMDAANVDLKGFTDEFYVKLCGAHLNPVLETLAYLKHETSVWFEITTLLIPGKNDSDEEIREESRWIMRELGPDVPLHFTAFHPDFKMTDIAPTPASTLARARRIAIDEGLNYVYTGNVHDREGGTTFCPGCKAALIERDWHRIDSYRVTDHGKCPDCGTAIPGRFEHFNLRRQWGRKRIPVAIGR